MVRRSGATAESVEARLMLSGSVKAARPHLPAGWTAAPFVLTQRHATPKAKPSFGSNSATAVGFGPTQIRGAYGFGELGSGNIGFNGIEGTGAGQTIAIVDAYDYPTAANDLHQFSVAYGLPDAPSFLKLNQTGGTTPPGVDTAGSLGNDWELEEALDIEWAHAMAPMANIILFEASDNDYGLYTAVQTAAAYPGVSVVSMSWGGDEYADETTDDAVFTSPANKGVTFLASSGDTGKERSYPAMSPNIVSVGGTSLNVAAGSTYASERAWSAGGGNISVYEPKPAYQVGTTDSFSTTYRAGPDVSMVADSFTGAAIYDTYDFGTAKPWSAFPIGGTSLSCPLWAGLVAVVNQGRAAAGMHTLNYSTSAAGNTFQTHTRLYQLRSSDYHDITTGSNGFAAARGYDLATGRGTPKADLLIPDLAGAATVTATVYIDANRNGSFDAGETVVPGKTVFLDLNGNGVKEAMEPSATTNASGGVLFTDQIGGGKVVLTGSAPAGYSAGNPIGATITYGVTTTAALLPYVQTTLSYTSAIDNAVVTLRLDPTGTIDQLIAAGSIVGSAALVNGSPVFVNLTGANQTLLLDSSHGNPVSTGGLTLTGTSAGNTTLSVYGTSAGDAFMFAQTAVAFSGKSISLSNVTNLLLTPGPGTNSINVASGSVTIPAANPGTAVTIQSWSSIAVAAGATLSFGTGPKHADRYLVRTDALSLAGTVDLGGNDMVIRNGSLSTVNDSAAAAFNGGLWNGTGLQSSAAAGNSLTTLGIAAGSGRDFDGYTASAVDVVIKFTYDGDANLDGKVDGSDYSLVDFGIASGATGFAAGDFDYSGSVDGSDYSLIDNAYNSQSAAL